MPYTIAILAPSPVPFQSGGAEKSLLALRAALEELPDCLAELIKIPVGEDTLPDLLDAYEMFSKLDLSHFDLLITTKYPAWMTPHHNHVLYMYHPLRGLYDMFHLSGCPMSLEPVPAPLHDLVELLAKPAPTRADLPLLFELSRRALSLKSLPSYLFAVPGTITRQIVRFLDRIALAPENIRGYFALSDTVARRSDYFPVTADRQILYLPPALQGLHCGESRYFFTASRLTSPKRLDLLIDAMSYVKADIQLKIAGTGKELEALRSRAALDKRIEFLGAVSNAELVELYANALAVPFVPLEEDYGLITVEAFASAKPVITVSDSGGPAELVRDGVNGLVVPPLPEFLGAALEKLAANPPLARKMGEAGKKFAAGLSWRKIALALTGQGVTTPFRPAVLVVAPFASDRLGAGGSRRLYHLCSELSAKYEVTLVAYGQQKSVEICKYARSAHWHEIHVPWPPEAVAEAGEWFEKLGTSADDLVLSRVAASHGLFIDTLKTQKADFALLAQPWLHDAVRKTFPQLPLGYDACDVVGDLKKSLYGDCELSREARDLENRVCSDADLIFVCSKEDLQRFQELYKVSSTKIKILPNGCELVSRPPDREALRRRLPFGETPIAIFMGSGHKPNVEAVLAIYDMAPGLPDVRFLIIGGVCRELAVSRAQIPPNVHLLDIVSEAVKNVLLARADIALNPMLNGSGTNLKMVEYLAAGIPCVSTPCGMRGLPRLPGIHICEIEEFPREIRKALEDDPHMLASVGKEIERQFAWPVALAELNVAVDNRMGRHYAADN